AVFVVVGPGHDLFAQVFSGVFGRLGELGDANNKPEDFERIFKPLMQAYGTFYRYVVLLFLLNTLLQAVIAVGLTRASMGLDVGGGFFYATFDKPVWKLFGAWLATYLIMYAAAAVIMFIGIMIAAVAGVGLVHADSGAGIPAFVVFCGVLVLAVFTLMAYLA